MKYVKHAGNVRVKMYLKILLHLYLNMLLNFFLDFKWYSEFLIKLMLIYSLTYMHFCFHFAEYISYNFFFSIAIKIFFALFLFGFDVDFFSSILLLTLILSKLYLRRITSYESICWECFSYFTLTYLWCTIILTFYCYNL